MDSAESVTRWANLLTAVVAVIQGAWPARVDAIRICKGGQIRGVHVFLILQTSLRLWGVQYHGCICICYWDPLTYSLTSISAPQRPSACLCYCHHDDR